MPRVRLSGPDAPRSRRPVVGVVRPVRPKIKDTPGAKRGVAIKKPAAPTPIKPPGPPPTPYDRYRETAPWAIPGLLQIDRDQAAHQSYVTDKVAPWLSQSLMGLQGYQDAAQSSYSNAIQGLAGGAMNVSAGMTPLGYGGGAMGGIVAGNNQYLTEGGSIRAAGGASALVQEALNRERFNRQTPIPYSQGAVQALADEAKHLPQRYIEMRRQRTEAVEKFIAEQQQAAAELAEEVRTNKVNEAIRATNAETNAAIQFGRLGLSAEDLAQDSAPDPRVGAPAPVGYVRDVDGTLKRDPTVPNATNASGGGSGPKPLSASTISSMNGSWKGSPNKPPKLGAGWKRPVWDVGTQRWYAKRAGAGAAAKAAKVVPYGKLVSDIAKQFNGASSGPFGSGTPGWAETFRGDQAGLRDAMADWVFENAASFNTRGGKFDPDKLLRVLATLGDGNRKFALIAPALKARIRNGRLV